MMEIRQVLRGNDTSFAASVTQAKAQDSKPAAAQSSADRLELSRQWVEQMQEQSRQIQALLSQPSSQKKSDEGGILDWIETEEDNADALSEEMKVRQKCLKIAMNIMKGKKVPPEDERYLMEHDPEGYKLAMAMKAMVKEDKEECESVLKDEDKEGETAETSDSGASAPAEGVSDGGGEAVES